MSEGSSGKSNQINETALIAGETCTVAFELIKGEEA